MAGDDQGRGWVAWLTPASPAPAGPRDKKAAGRGAEDHHGPAGLSRLKPAAARIGRPTATLDGYVHRAALAIDQQQSLVLRVAHGALEIGSILDRKSVV